jgi:signal transduction histidine kinase
MEAEDQPQSTGKLPRGFITLSRQIMNLANQGIPRVEFLQELSKLLLRFSGCDALELRIRGKHEYRWRAVCRPEQSFVYEALGVDEPESGPTSSDERGSLSLGRIVHDELEGKVDHAAPCFTPHGSFWTGDVVDTVTRHSTQNDDRLGVYADTTSMALIPFAIDVDNFGILRLENALRDEFTLEMIELYEAVMETLGLAIAQRRAQAALRERVKELACLYSIARVVEDSTGDVEEALEQIVRILPPAWQFPEVAVARITLDGHAYSPGDFEAARSRQVAKIVVNGRSRGEVEVGYVEDVQHVVNGPFLEEEEQLIRGVARKIGAFLERRQAAAERVKLEAQLRHADRLATIGQLAAGVAHEINEPLGSILGYAQLAGKGCDLAEDTANDLKKIVAASLQAREIVTKLKLFARQAPIEVSWVSVAPVVDYALTLVETRCANEGIEIVKRVESDLPDVPADPVQLKQIMVNLIVNGIQAMPNGGTLTVVASCDESSVVIEVRDTGMGMTEEVMEQIFNPFFTTKDVGEGTGLGLCVVHGIVTAHGGTTDVESEVGKGSKLTVRLPFQADLWAEVDQERVHE